MLSHARDRGETHLVLRNPDDVAIIEGVPETTDGDLIEPEVRAERNRARPTPQVETIEHVGSRRP